MIAKQLNKNLHKFLYALLRANVNYYIHVEYPNKLKVYKGTSQKSDVFKFNQVILVYKSVFFL